MRNVKWQPLKLKSKYLHLSHYFYCKFVRSIFFVFLFVCLTLEWWWISMRIKILDKSIDWFRCLDKNLPHPKTIISEKVDCLVWLPLVSVWERFGKHTFWIVLNFLHAGFNSFMLLYVYFERIRINMWKNWCRQSWIAYMIRRCVFVCLPANRYTILWKWLVAQLFQNSHAFFPLSVDWLLVNLCSNTQWIVCHSHHIFV